MTAFLDGREAIVVSQLASVRGIVPLKESVSLQTLAFAKMDIQGQTVASRSPAPSLLTVVVTEYVLTNRRVDA